MTSSSAVETEKGNQGEGKGDATAAVSAAADPSNANRRYNPYDGMDPSDPNYVGIPPEEFQEMMRKKKAMGIPSIEVLREKTEKFNLQPDASVVVSNNSNSSEKETNANGSESETKDDDEEENIPPPEIPLKWRKYLQMQKARVPDEAILQLAKVKGMTPTNAEVSELRELLGMEVMEDDENDTPLDVDTATATAAPVSPTSGYPPRPPPKHFKKFLTMQKSGIPKEAILQSAKIQGHDISKLEKCLDEAGKQDSGGGNETTSATVSQQQGNRNHDRSRFSQYIKMREKGISIAFVLEAARNQFVTASESTELEKILTEIEPTKSTRAIIAGHKTKAAPPARSFTDSTSATAATAAAAQGKNQLERVNQWFSIVPQKEEDKPKDGGQEEDEEEEKEEVAFHHERTSPLASLVRKMAFTVDKTKRSSQKRTKKGASSGANDDLVVNSKTLYQALGSFKGVQIARDNYNETLVACEKSDKQSQNAGWIRAKRQSFREIAKFIGVKLPTSNATTTKDGAPARATIDGLDALVRYIEDRYSDEIQESLTLLREDNLYDFDSLPALYVPGSKVVAKNICSGGIDMICRVAWNRMKSGKTITGQISRHFEVCFEFVVAVGVNKATIAEVVEGIEEFQGRRNIFSSVGLTFVPWMAYSEEEQESLLEKYRRRGRIYNEVALNHCPGAENEENQYPRPTYSYKAYRKGCFFVKRGGFGGTVNPASASRGMATGGRIIIDSQGAYDYGNSLGVGYDPMITGIHYKLKEYRLHQSRSASDQQLGGNSRANQIVDAAGNSYSRSTQPKSRRYGDSAANRDKAEDDDSGMVLFDTIPDDYLELVWPCVIGFSLTAKAWGDCLVDGLEDILFSEDVFDRLVLPDDRKRLIKALVKHSSPKSSGLTKHNFQDLIKGKGEGTVFLLYGPPGVGKTLTAEAVSEVLQRPLYSLSMGTLGTTADDLERRLSEILKLSAKWNAIILLDEADSFLEKRSSTSSLERNAMVSVMLQLVEYFTGILFLTSNRMDSLDDAFQTRITLSLPYHELTEDGRQKIWENLLHKSGVLPDSSSSSSLPFPPIDTRELAKHRLNGREIKNALRMALALASEEDRSLGHELLMETSSMVKPISAFGKRNDKVDNPPRVEVPNSKASFSWHSFVPGLIFLFLMMQSSVIVFLMFQNGSECHAEIENEGDMARQGRSLFGRSRH